MAAARPCTGLTRQDFTVSEDGVAREVIERRPGDRATDDLAARRRQSGGDRRHPVHARRDPELRAAPERQGGNRALPPIGERPTNQIDYTTSADALKKVVGTSLPEAADPARYLLDGHRRSVARAAEARGQAADIVAISTEGPRVQQPLPPAGARCAADASGASLHVLALGQPSASIERRDARIATS